MPPPARLDRFLYGLGIRHVGEHMARLLARHFRSLDPIRQAESRDLQQLPEVGETIATSVQRFFAHQQNQKVLAQFASLGVEVQDMPAASAGAQPLADKTFVFTGALEHYTRDETRNLEEARQRHVQVLDEEAFREVIDDMA